MHQALLAARCYSIQNFGARGSRLESRRPEQVSRFRRQVTDYSRSAGLFPARRDPRLFASVLAEKPPMSDLRSDLYRTIGLQLPENRAATSGCVDRPRPLLAAPASLSNPAGRRFAVRAAGFDVPPHWCGGLGGAGSLAGSGGFGSLAPLSGGGIRCGWRAQSIPFSVGWPKSSGCK